REAEDLVRKDVLREKQDIFYLSFDELRECVRSGNRLHELVDRRKLEQQRFEKLFPPRFMTSDGEIIFGEYKRENVPPNAIVGLPVSSGVIEGRARVFLSLEDANPEQGDILVTRFTDPS